MVEKWVVFYNKGSRGFWDQTMLGPFDTQDQALFALLNEAYKRKVNITPETWLKLEKQYLNRWVFKGGQGFGCLAAYIDRSR